MTESDSLRKQTKRGLYWSAISNITNKGLQFVFSIILAKLLAPSDYGIVGMLTIFIAVVQLFVDSGFSKAIITKNDRTQTDLSTAFYFNIIVGLVGYSILFISSSWIADFYEMPILEPILKVTGLGVVINSLNIVQTAHYAILLDFKTPAIISFISNTVSGCIGIFLAYRGAGVWALVFQSIGGSLLTLVLNWYNVRWMPSLVFSQSSFKYLWGFGCKVLGSSIISTIYDNIQTLIIGKFFSANSLGLFTRAHGFAVLPSSNISSILGSVTFPLLSKINDDVDKLRDVYRKLIKLSAFVVFPLMIGMASLSEPIVKILLPERWYDCIPMLQIICFSLVWHPISAVNLNLLNAAQKPEVVLKLELIKKPLGLVLLFCSIPFGVIAMCWANLSVCLFAVVINTIMTSKALNVSFFDQLKDILPAFFHGLIMGALVYSVSLIQFDYIYCLIVGFLVGATYYILAAKFFMNDLFHEALYMLKRKSS